MPACRWHAQCLLMLCLHPFSKVVIGRLCRLPCSSRMLMRWWCLEITLLVPVFLGLPTISTSHSLCSWCSFACNARSGGLFLFSIPSLSRTKWTGFFLVLEFYLSILLSYLLKGKGVFSVWLSQCILSFSFHGYFPSCSSHAFPSPQPYGKTFGC